MKILSLMLLVLVASCGGSGGSSSSTFSSSDTRQVTVGPSLNITEESLVADLLSESPIHRVKLIKKLLTFDNLTDATLSRIDQVLSVECFSDSDECFVERR